jgi:hypothetical protein
LDRERLVLRDAEPDHLALRIECIEIYVGDDAKRI